MPEVGRFLSALGIDPTKATDTPHQIFRTKDSVFVIYEAIVELTPEDYEAALGRMQA